MSSETEDRQMTEVKSVKNPVDIFLGSLTPFISTYSHYSGMPLSLAASLEASWILGGEVELGNLYSTEGDVFPMFSAGIIVELSPPSSWISLEVALGIITDPAALNVEGTSVSFEGSMFLGGSTTLPLGDILNPNYAVHIGTDTGVSIEFKDTSVSWGDGYAVVPDFQAAFDQYAPLIGLPPIDQQRAMAESG